MPLGETYAQGKEEEPRQTMKTTMTREQIASLVSRFDTVPDSDTLYTLTLPSPAASLALDKLGNVFVITQRGEVLRYDSLGKLQANYRELRYGQPAYIDVSDPYNLILSYPQAARVTLLDNNLVSKGMISLPTLDQDGAASGRNAVACRSADGNLWFWDDLAFRLVKVNSTTGAVIQEGELLQGSSYSAWGPISPYRLLETEQRVYLVNDYGESLEYDFFGAYRRQFWLRGTPPGVFDTTIPPGQMLKYFQGQSLDGGLLVTIGGPKGGDIDQIRGDDPGVRHWISSLRPTTWLWALNGAYVAEVDSADGVTLIVSRR
jgi:hypothetical protein